MSDMLHHIPLSVMVTMAVFGVPNKPPFGVCRKTLNVSVPSTSESSISKILLHCISPSLLIIGNVIVSGSEELVSAECGRQQKSSSHIYYMFFILRIDSLSIIIATCVHSDLNLNLKYISANTLHNYPQV